MSITNDYYQNYNSKVSNTHSWRTVSYCLPFLQDDLNKSKGLKILDVGCGPGSITFDIYENYGNSNKIIGLDTPLNLIDSCKLNYCNGNNSVKNIKKNLNLLEFIQGSIYELPFKDNEFDIVYCHQVLIHLKDPIKGLNEMKRVVNKKIGKLFICEAEIRSLLIYPLDYQLILTEYFKIQHSTFTKDSFGLSLLQLYQTSNDYDNTNNNTDESKVNFGVVPWCITKKHEKNHFALMYVDRLEDKKNLPNYADFVAAWKEWSEHPSSVLVMTQGYLSVDFSQ